MADTVSRGDVVAFRLHAHHLGERLGADEMVQAAAACGVQDSPPGSALLALHARVRGLSRQQVGQAVADTKSLLETWCMRGSPFVVPAVDAPVFTTGVLPPTEESMRHFLPGVGPALEALDMSLGDAVALCGEEVHGILSGRRLGINELGAALAARIARRLPPTRRGVWEEQGPYAPGQPLGEAVVHFCVRILTLQRVVCIAPRVRSTAPFVLVEEWLGQPIPDVDADVARAELLRRYLRCYGPSTRAGFAAWLGIRARDVDPWWSLVEDELTGIEFGGRAWLLTADVDTLRSAPDPRGVRLLPPRDPYTQLRDRETILDAQFHAGVWKAVGSPGVVLTDGRITGTWRPRKSGRTLTITVTAFDAQRGPGKDLIQREAYHVAALRGASSVDVVHVVP